MRILVAWGILANVLRSVALLLVPWIVVGCDQVWQLHRDDPPPVCGPYRAPEQVAFAPALAEPHDLSVDASGTRGMVHAKRMSSQSLLWTGPHAITKDVDGTWIPDDPHDRPVLNDLDGAHLFTGLDGEVRAVGWIERPRTPSMYEYGFATVAWTQSGGFIDPFTAETARAGNLIEIAFGVGSIKFAVLIQISEVAGEPNHLRIQQLFPGRNWELTPQASPLEADGAINPNGGALTADHNALVYSARVDGSMASRLYGTPRKHDEFSPGQELIIADVPADADLTEPWIDDDCGTLYFRRDGTTWMTTANK